MNAITHVYALLLCALFVGVKSNRKVTAVLNPGCNIPLCKDKNNVILVHVKAEGNNDTLHHIWDFTGKPNFLLALTDNNATVSVAWTAFALGKEGGVTIEPPPKYVFAVVVDKLIEFNDEDNTGTLNPDSNNASYVTLYDMKNFNWTMVGLTNTSGDATLTVEANSYYDDVSKTGKNGTIRIEMSSYGGEDHAESLPHLLHSSNASQFDLTLDHLSKHYKRSRFGLNLITVSSDDPKNAVTLKSRKTMDDEHAPGTFTIMEMLTPEVQSGGYGGYLQWRPIVYLSPTRDMTSNTESIQYSVIPASDPMLALNHTLLFSTFGSKLDSMLVVATNVTFGNQNDGFYGKTNFATWTLLMGYGRPPQEQFSMLVTLVLILGLGIPTALILIGTMCIVLRRLQRNKDDLFLSR